MPEASLFPCDTIVPDWPAPPTVRALCTTRSGGVSAPPYDSLNLGDHVGDEAPAVARNRARLAQTLGVRPVFLQQVHGVEMLDLQHATPDAQVADGASTRCADLACTVLVADCLPILLCDAQGQQVAALHAGWRGLAGTKGQGVVERIYATFRPPSRMGYGFVASDLIAWLGPCIGPQAFEVGPEVRAAFCAVLPQAQACFEPLGGGKYLDDLAGLARQRLQALGVQRIYGNDASPAWCTYGNSQRFFSYRRDGACGRMAACIWLQGAAPDPAT